MLRRSGLETVSVATSAPPARSATFELDRAATGEGSARVAHPAASAANTDLDPQPLALGHRAVDRARARPPPPRPRAARRAAPLRARAARRSGPTPAAAPPASAGSSSPASWRRGFGPAPRPRWRSSRARPARPPAAISATVGQARGGSSPRRPRRREPPRPDLLGHVRQERREQAQEHAQREMQRRDRRPPLRRVALGVRAHLHQLDVVVAEAPEQLLGRLQRQRVVELVERRGRARHQAAQIGDEREVELVR